MSTELAVTGGHVVVPDNRLALIKTTIAKDANLSNDELSLFAMVCNRVGLDPFARQIYAIRRSGKMTIQTSIDGFRLVAERSGKYLGQDGPYWCGADGKWTDVWLQSTEPAAAKVGVVKAGAAGPITSFAVVTMKDFKADGPLWKSMPAHMLAKCAESQALRKAFPQELSGLYTSEEMQQADKHGETLVSIPVGGPAHNATASTATDEDEVVADTTDACPHCGSTTAIHQKRNGSWYCKKAEGGCGADFDAPGALSVVSGDEPPPPSDDAFPWQ